ncbi:penicillin-binding protein [Candidatus Woesebacteria bacterium CG_4_10_14_0_2_um_filter_39_14]|uniref:Penicillin-binding protein n=1 Tax=Candidatus Woesebacteria bacterium CG_4_10_14_0_2_um_filter_39_14 TaxID=1975054 RepID=A0A2M7TM03_9BACT|nr:MAG: penicillin-binding protein [Candidatus Woesebacteria bacterium CG_4_10_14_0_2_um_filter_39_14]
MSRWQEIWQQRNSHSRRRLHLPHHRKIIKSKFFARLALFCFIGLIALGFLMTGLFAFYVKDLPQPDKIIRREGFSTKIYDRNGELLYDIFSNQKRTPVELKDVPQHLRNATIAIEDKNFYQHGGFDPTGMFRALYNIVVHRRLQGGSTLTQQLVKNVLLTSQRTIPRKLKEFILAVQIEKKYSKDQILQMYLNEAPYGGTAWGAAEAAETYFNKNVSELNLIESAVLAGLPQRPSVYSPFSDSPQAYVVRTEQVLRRMREDGYISREQEKEALKQLDKIEFATEGSNFKAPHFVMYVKKQLEERYGQQVVEGGGLRVYTTLDLDIQEEAQKAVTEEIAKVEAVHITNGAALVMDPNNGEILAMVGSKNYNDPNYDGKVNVTLSLRQPGSAIKPVTYLTALKKGYTAATLLMDTPTTFPIGGGQPDYKPVNYDGQFHGPLQMRFALGNSINVPAVKMLAQVGLKEMLQTGYELGLSTLEPTTDNLKRFGLSVTLGGGEVRLLELVEAYAAFANGGLKVEPISILKVTDKDDKVLFEQKNTQGRRVITEPQAFLISHILSDNNARLITFGERSALNVPGRTVAVKTGTTNDKRDNWTIGWTPQVVAGVWVGNNDNSQMKEVASGISGATPIWRRIIQAALADKSNLSFNVPEGIVTAEVDQVSGYRVHDGYPSRIEYFIKGTEPTGDDPIHAKLKLCRGQDKLATVAQIARGEYEEKEYFVFQEDDPISSDGINRWQQGIDEWLAGQGDSRYHPPKEYCGSTTEIEVSINEPANRTQIDSNDVKVAGKIVATNDIKKIEILINNELKETIENSKKFEKIFNLDKGTYKIKVRAYDNQGNQGEREAEIGVQVPWDWQPTPSPTPNPSP